jgi:uncharacterized membrane protein
MKDLAWLVLGLLLFLGAHSTRVLAEDWRGRQLARWGEKGWKGAVALVSLAGFILLIWGYGQARQAPVLLWQPPRGMNHLAALLTLVAFILLLAAYVPRNAIRARLRHPMVLGVKVWALAHLLANGTLSAVVLFGAFLVWAVVDFRAARARDRASQAEAATSGAPDAPTPSMMATALTVVLGAIAWAGFAFWAHGAWIGVRPLG